MKYLKYFEENSKQESLDKVFQDCQYYINLVKNCEEGKLFVRGMYEYSETFIKKYTHNWNRQPLDTPSDWHELLNEMFHRNFGWYVRSGVFCFMKNGKDASGNKNPLVYNTGYGNKTFLLFPIGEFCNVWSPYVRDLWSDYEDQFNGYYGAYVDTDYGEMTPEQEEEGQDRFIAELETLVHTKYKTGLNICKIPITSEVSLDCDEYYLIDMLHLDEIIERIWK